MKVILCGKRAFNKVKKGFEVERAYNPKNYDIRLLYVFEHLPFIGSRLYTAEGLLYFFDEDSLYIKLAMSNGNFPIVAEWAKLEITLEDVR